jgi:altronate dehydratase large subunit
MGYKRPDGGVGVRNDVAVIPAVFCANKTARWISERVPGTIYLNHAVGCAQVGLDLEFTARTLCAAGRHPNIAAVLVVGLGCERFKPEELYEAVKATGKPVEMVIVQDEGGTTGAIKKGVELLEKLAKTQEGVKREECDIANLMVATKCGGTDATSGLAANPALGAACDMLIAQGGSAILSELNELIGTEHILARRAVDEDVAQRIRDAVYEVEERLKNGCDDRYPERNHLISPGNFEGGVSSIVEKALGGIHKSGSSRFVDVLPYAIPPKTGKRGLFLMNSDSHDGEVVTGMAGCGAQIVCFTTGRGNTVGFPFAPVIKITGNDFTYNKMRENTDFNAAGIISGGVSVREMGERLFDLVLRVAEGEQTTAEALEADELFCVARRFRER